MRFFRPLDAHIVAGRLKEELHYLATGETHV
jgi:hypothetical protein